RVRAADRQRGNYLAWLDSRDAVAEPIHNANQIPPRREGQPGRLRMNALTHHQIRQGDTCGLHLYANFAILRFGALFFNHPKCIGPAVVGDDDAPVFHGTSSSLAWRSTSTPHALRARASRTSPAGCDHEPLATARRRP